MAKGLIELKLDDDQTVWVEASDDETFPEASVGGPIRRSDDGAMEASQQKLSDAAQRLEPIAKSIFDRLRVAGIEEATLEVGMKFSSKAGVILVSADSEATFKISLKWKPPKQ